MTTKEVNTEEKKNYVQHRDGTLSVTRFTNTKERKNDKGETVVSEWYSYKLQRGYKNKKGEWENTESLREQDLLPMSELLREAYKETKDL